MAHKAGVRLFVIRLRAVLLKQRAGPRGQRVHPARLQFAGRRFDNTVAAPGIKPGHDAPVRPAADRQLHLVAVALRQRGGQRRGHRHIQPAQPGKSVAHKAGFGGQFRLIGQMPQAAPAAGAAHGAVRFLAAGAGGHDALNAPVGIGLERFDDTHLQHIAGRAARHEHGHAARGAANAGPVAGKALNGQGQQLIFGKYSVRHNKTFRCAIRKTRRRAARGAPVWQSKMLNGKQKRGGRFTAAGPFPARPDTCWAARP